MQHILLKVGTNSISIDMTGVSIQGMMVSSDAQVMQKVSAGVMTQVTGAVVMIN